jgi:hypothetical protein
LRGCASTTTPRECLPGVSGSLGLRATGPSRATSTYRGPYRTTRHAGTRRSARAGCARRATPRRAAPVSRAPGLASSVAYTGARRARCATPRSAGNSDVRMRAASPRHPERERVRPAQSRTSARRAWSATSRRHARAHCPDDLVLPADSWTTTSAALGFARTARVPASAARAAGARATPGAVRGSAARGLRA